MATIITEVYDAFRSVGAAEDVARKAAEALPQTGSRRSDFESRLNTFQWMVGANIGLTLLLLGKLLLAR